MTATFITQKLVRSPIRHPKLADLTDHPRPRFKGHWAIGTRNLAEANRFYETLTGTELICRPAPFSTAVSWDDEHHRFFIMDVAGMTRDPATGAELRPPEDGPQERTGVGLASIRFGSTAALKSTYDAMNAAGWLPELLIDRGAMRSMIYRDPDGMLVEAFAAVDAPERAATTVNADIFFTPG